MADETNPKDRNPDAEAPAEQEPSKKQAKVAFWRRLLTPKSIVILVVASIAIHGAGFAFFRLLRESAPVAGTPEVSLGVFRFEAEDKAASPVAKAEFSLHIALLDQVDTAARRRLEDRRFRVQQDVEELLRQAHGGDFVDPKLLELKRRLQEQVNETLGMRAIADVIITDLHLEQGGGDLVGLATDAVESVPWVEKPSG